LRFPPYVFLETDEYVRIVGEEIKIRCTTHNPNFNYNVTWKYTTKSNPMVEETVRSNGENRLDIQSILTISAVDLADTGNISCIGTNEAGVNSTTTYLLVVDKPYIRLLPQLSPKLTLKGLSVVVKEGEDLELSLLIEAYPHITEQGWLTPTPPNTSTQEHKFIRYNNRYLATLQVKRMNIQEQGQYTFYAKSDLTNASISFQVQMYQRPNAVVRWENVTTLTCTSFGYPAPRIIWYQCLGIRPTCNENTSGLQLAIPLQAPTVEVQREEYGAVEVESVLTVGPSSQRMTVECVAFNLVGVSRDTLAMEVSDKLFMTTLSGAAGILAILLVLDSGISSFASSSYLEMRPSQLPNTEQSRETDCEETGDWPLDIDDLLRFSLQVAQGLDFLAAKNASVLPVSHMIAAPGSRVTCYFTASKWDCGLMILMNKPLLLHCITTFTGLAECCRSWLYSLARVTPRPLFLYAIMKMCWNLEPTKRPTFCKIGQMIEKLLGGHLEEEQVIYQNMQQEVTEADAYDKPKCHDGPCDQSCDHEEEEQPLMKTNNYQFC
ncbi:hypothetical protein CCH79_00006064, partial [Gambusia affinis]